MIIGFVFTNYNNSQLSINAVESILKNQGDCKCSIVIVDNNSTEEEQKILAESDVVLRNCIIIWNSKNVGYFNGLNVGIDALLELNLTHHAVVIGNNDLLFDSHFFDGLKLRSRKIMQYSVVSPNIVTLDNEHQNPHVKVGISRIREVFYDLYFSSYYISVLILSISSRLRFLFERKDHLAHAQEGPIYSGYGACYILSPRFFEFYKRLWSPGFVMGEEFFLTKQLESQGERMYYLPDIIVHHHDHATVSKLPSRKLWEMTREAHEIYRFFINPYSYRMDPGKTPDDYDSRYRPKDKALQKT
jgi:GT2 family glycosyltransferase